MKLDSRMCRFGFTFFAIYRRGHDFHKLTQKCHQTGQWICWHIHHLCRVSQSKLSIDLLSDASISTNKGLKSQLGLAIALTLVAPQTYYNTMIWGQSRWQKVSWHQNCTSQLTHMILREHEERRLMAYVERCSFRHIIETQNVRSIV